MDSDTTKSDADVDNDQKSSSISEQVTVNSGVYRHFKGAYYLVLGVAANSEMPDEKMVVYVGLYAKPGPRMWVRPLEMFTETVERDGKIMPRFQYIGQEMPNNIETKLES